MIVSKTLFDADAVTGSGDTAVAISSAMHDFQAVSNRDYQRGFTLPNWLPTADNRLRNRAAAAFNQVMEQIIAERRHTAVNGQITDTGDLLSMLMLSVDEDGAVMDDRQLRDEVATLFAAGHETTSNALSWTWYLLAQHPQVEAKLHAELDGVLAGRHPTLADLPNLPYTLQIIKESMRLYPPAWILNGRIALEDVQLGGYTVPKGSTLFISPYVMHHLPQYFADPEAFQPERFTAQFEKSLPKYAYMPFGGGTRVCIGNSFAMMEAQLILATVAQQFRLTLATDKPVRYNAQITLTPVDGIPMRVVEREAAEEANLAYA
jgi:cytochrome P450